MGRHRTTATREKPAPVKRHPRQALTEMARKVWQAVLSEDFRRRMWHRRRRWRAWWDRRYAPRTRGWEDGKQWEASLPKDPANWSDAWDHIGSYAVAAELRRRHAERGDLLPSRPRIEPLQEEA